MNFSKISEFEFNPKQDMSHKNLKTGIYKSNSNYTEKTKNLSVQ